MKLIIQTQFEENYGAHCWDGKGECPQYWKMKGGSEYQLNLSIEQCAKMGFTGLNRLVSNIAKVHINKDNDYNREYVHDWTLLDDNEKSELEALFSDEPFYRYSPNVIETACVSACMTM